MFSLAFIKPVLYLVVLPLSLPKDFLAVDELLFKAKLDLFKWHPLFKICNFITIIKLGGVHH